MKTDELIKRYIYAVTKHLKPANRKDIGEELDSIIQDMLSERCADRIPTENDVRVVLAELGTPETLAQKYDEHGNDCLIGPPYYSAYLSILKLVVICVVCGMFIAHMIAGVMNGDLWYEILINLICGIIGGLPIGFSILTLIFAFFYHKGIQMDNLYDSLSNLPPVPANQKLIPKRDAIAGIIISILFLIVFLFCPQIFSAVFPETHTAIPIFNVDYIRDTWYVLIIFTILGISRECVKLIDGMYTKRLLVVSMITDILSAIFTYIWMRSERLVNPEFIAAVRPMFMGEDDFIVQILSHFNYFFICAIVFALFIDLLVTGIKTALK